eukprot:g4495.t1
MDDLRDVDRQLDRALHSSIRKGRRVYRRQLDWEMRFMLRLQKWRLSPRSGALPRLLDLLVSESAAGDVASLNWPIWLYSIVRHGGMAGWVILASLCFGVALTHVFKARKPYQRTKRLRPLTRTFFHAFPCLHTLFATSVSLQLAYLSAVGGRGGGLGVAAAAAAAWPAWLCACLWIAVVAGTRVYACCVLPHQAAAGVAAGSLILAVLHIYYLRHHHEMYSEQAQVLSCIFVVVCFVAYGCWWAEELNENPFFGSVPKQEFIRVLGNIAEGEVTDTSRGGDDGGGRGPAGRGGPGTGSGGGGDDDDDGAAAGELETDTDVVTGSATDDGATSDSTESGGRGGRGRGKTSSPAGAAGIGGGGRRGGRPRKPRVDSFVAMMRNMERRATNATRRRAGGGGGRFTSGSDTDTSGIATDGSGRSRRGRGGAGRGGGVNLI